MKEIINKTFNRKQTIKTILSKYKQNLHVKFVNFRMKWVVLPYSDILHILKKQNALKLKFTHFPVIKNTIKRIAFKNAYESSIIFQSFLYASIPAESTSYAPAFFAKWF